MSKKNYCLGHTKPLFSKHKILALPDLGVYHTFLELFKILKYHAPISMYALYSLSQRGTNFLLHLPTFQLEKSKNNFVYSSCTIWNRFVGNILERSLPNTNGIIVQGSSRNSDFCATVPYIKSRLKTQLLDQQAFGDEINLVTQNFLL